MEITTGSPEWDEVEDRQIWRQFLETRTGKRLIPKTLDSCPVLLGKGDTNEILIRNGELRGIQLVIQSLLSLSRVEQPIESVESDSAYPPLDDDSKWSDGQKINP